MLQENGNARRYIVAHPWRLIFYKILYFPILTTINKISRSKERKLYYKQRLIFDKLSGYSRNRLWE